MSENIVYATDENYWLPLLVSLYSLLENNPQEEFNIYILSKNKNEGIYKNIKELEQTYEGVSVEFVQVSEEEFSSAPEPRWFNEGIYYRLLLDSLLPIENENVLYIDCDTVVDGSLSGLFSVCMDNHIAAGVPEPSNKSFWFGLPADAPFYNTGILYINLELWDKYNIEKDSIKFIKESDSLYFPLQQILNTLLHEKGMWKSLSPEYNAMVGAWIGGQKSKKFDKSVDPKIIHYYGSPKPWEYMYLAEYREEWWNYLEKTPYSGYKPEGKTWRSTIIKSFFRTVEPYPRLYNLAQGAYNTLKE